MKILRSHRYVGRQLHNFGTNLETPRHRWYWFKEGFSHQLVREAVEHHKPRRSTALRVLDPFGGCGTTALTSAVLGHDSCSIDVNPFCVLTTRAKCATGRWREAPFLERIEEVAAAAMAGEASSPLEGYSTFCEGNDRPRWLFSRGVLRAAQAAISAADRYMCDGRALALKLAAVKAAVSCCHAKKDGKCLRYYRDWDRRSYTGEDFVLRFRSAATMMLHDVHLCPIGGRRRLEVYEGDCRKLLRTVEGRSFDLVVMSPPYLNSFDYTDVYRPELFLSGLVRSDSDLRALRLRTMRSHVQANWDRRVDLDSKHVRRIVRQLESGESLWDKRIPRMVEAYFDDSHRVLEQLFRVLRPGGACWAVVSTSAYHGIHIPVDSILMELSSQVGFTLDAAYVLRELRSSGQHWQQCARDRPPLRESLLVLKR